MKGPVLGAMVLGRPGVFLRVLRLGLGIRGQKARCMIPACMSDPASASNCRSTYRRSHVAGKKYGEKRVSVLTGPTVRFGRWMLVRRAGRDDRQLGTEDFHPNVEAKVT